MSASTLDRVAKLIALAAGEGEEARTAAWQACRLIRDHKLVVGGAAADTVRFASTPPVDGGADRVESMAGLGGICCACLTNYLPGSRVVFFRGVGMCHDVCADEGGKMQAAALKADAANAKRRRRQPWWRG